MRRSRLNHVSAKRRAEQPARRRCIAAVRKRSGGRCEARVAINCTGQGQDVHEIQSRAQGGSVTDETNCVHVCRNCHNLIHACPSASYANGWLIKGNGKPIKKGAA